MIKARVRKNSYYDSVTLMLITREVKKIEGVREVLVGMGTELNISLVDNLNLNTDELKDITANDFFVVADIKDESLFDKVEKEIDNQLNKKKEIVSGDYRPPTLTGALNQMKDANFALISVAGNYAYQEANDALDKGLNIMMFSDNLPLDEELKLKRKAVEKSLLMMGPDCGTAIINGVALAFANKVRRGRIGIVAASGTGSQEVSVIIDKLGEGVSQLIGTGGRDLSKEIGGLMMEQGFVSLINDSDTDVIILISKPPAKEVAVKILSLIKTTKKPVIVNFIGGDEEDVVEAGGIFASNLDEAARIAVSKLKGENFNEESVNIDLEEIKKLTNNLNDSQKNFRGLYTGGTLADESLNILSDFEIYSNIAFEEKYKVENLDGINKNICLDLGEDKYTMGRPHPMIDPETRGDFFKSHIDSSVAVVLFDLVLGYGAHEDPAKAICDSINELKGRLGKMPIIVASITGTSEDYQGYEKSLNSLEEVGVIVKDSNAQAALYVKEIMKNLQEKEVI